MKSPLQLAVQNFFEESRLATQMLDHAVRLRYPRYREELEIVAGEEHRHAALLRGWIQRQGADIPTEASPEVKGGRNDWERLRQDYEDDLALSDKYLHDAYEVDGESPELAALFLQIRSQEREHRQTLLRLVMRHDCYDS